MVATRQTSRLVKLEAQRDRPALKLDVDDATASAGPYRRRSSIKVTHKCSSALSILGILTLHCKIHVTYIQYEFFQSKILNVCAVSVPVSK